VGSEPARGTSSLVVVVVSSTSGGGGEVLTKTGWDYSWGGGIWAGLLGVSACEFFSFCFWVLGNGSRECHENNGLK
jgi:hypothetical protein